MGCHRHQELPNWRNRCAGSVYIQTKQQARQVAKYFGTERLTDSSAGIEPHHLPTLSNSPPTVLPAHHHSIEHPSIDMKCQYHDSELEGCATDLQ